MFDAETFFAAIRRSGLLGSSLSQPQVDGTTALLDSAARNGVTDPDHVAFVLANVVRETGGHMLGIKETVMPGHKDKNPSDATVIARLNKAWATGKLKGVKAPYWRDGWFGRGPIQITHRDNYLKFEKRLGVHLTRQPGLALDPRIGADIAVIGMRDGMFRGVKLADFTFPDAVKAAPKSNPRRIVNGNDGSDAEVAKSYRVFREALAAAGFGEEQPATPSPAPVETPKAVPAPQPAPQPQTPPVAKPTAGRGFWAILFDIIGKFLKGGK